MRKFYHFLPKPELPKMTPREQRMERLNFERDIGFMKVYALFLATFISLAYIVQWIAYDPIGDLHTEICAHSSNSPLCKDFALLERVDTIASKKNVPTRLVVWIANAESSIWVNYNKPACASRNNPYGLKGRKFDDWNVVMYAKNRKKPDKDGCFLYHFKSFEEATESLVNTISMWYKSCNNDIVCLSFSYVGDPNVSEKSWVKNVDKFAKTRKEL